MSNRKKEKAQNPIDFLDQMITNTGESVGELQEKNPVLVVFLRHFGCSFCREAMGEIAKQRPKLEENGRKIVFVHMGKNALAEEFLSKYDLLPVHHVSDENTFFYRIFGLMKGSASQIFGLMNWIRGFESSILKGHGFANPSENSGLGDGFQMPGVFVLFKNEICEEFIHENPYDRPDYLQIMNCCKF
jgi:peroxiredoxin